MFQNRDGCFFAYLVGVVKIIAASAYMLVNIHDELTTFLALLDTRSILVLYFYFLFLNRDS